MIHVRVHASYCKHRLTAFCAAVVITVYYVHFLIKDYKHLMNDDRSFFLQIINLKIFETVTNVGRNCHIWLFSNLNPTYYYNGRVENVAECN